MCSGNKVSAVGAHGPQGRNERRGARLWFEIYRNYAHCPQPRWAFAHIRGGNGVIWGNRSDDTEECVVLALEQIIGDRPFDPERPAGKTTSLYVWDNLNRGAPCAVSFRNSADASLFKEGPATS